MKVRNTKTMIEDMCGDDIINDPISPDEGKLIGGNLMPFNKTTLNCIDDTAD
jgi:hypothetical protein